MTALIFCLTGFLGFLLAAEADAAHGAWLDRKLILLTRKSSPQWDRDAAAIRGSK